MAKDKIKTEKDNTGWEKQIKDGALFPHPSKPSDEFALADLTALIDELHKENERNNPNHEADAKFMDLIAPYLHMTEEEMNEKIPHGCYEMSGNGYVAITGKGGLIMTILAMQKQMNNFGYETKRNIK